MLLTLPANSLHFYIWTGNMSFSKIKDPLEAQKMVEEYQRMKAELKHEWEEKRESKALRNESLEAEYRPVTQSQAEMTKKIVQAIEKRKHFEENIPVKEEVKEEPRKKRRLEREIGIFADRYRNRYVHRDESIDTTFGITFHNDQAFIGDTPITIENDDIIIYDKVYNGTKGLWRLLTEKKEARLKDEYNDDDLEEYANILQQTNVLHKENDPHNPLPKSSGSYKWKKILGPIWKQEESKEGTGILQSTGSYISGTPKGMLDQLQLLYAEHQAGNTEATVKPMRDILKELLRIDYIDLMDYIAIMRKIHE